MTGLSGLDMYAQMVTYSTPSSEHLNDVLLDDTNHYIIPWHLLSYMLLSENCTHNTCGRLEGHPQVRYDSRR